MGTEGGREGRGGGEGGMKEGGAGHSRFTYLSRSAVVPFIMYLPRGGGGESISHTEARLQDD